MQTVIKIPFKSHGHSCVVEQDATGYLWFYIDNLTLALLPACVPEWLREEGEARLNGAEKGVKK